MCYGLFFASLKRRPKKDFLRPKLFFLIKIFNFYQKNNFPPIDFLPARFSSEAMSAFRAIKPKAGETVRNTYK